MRVGVQESGAGGAGEKEAGEQLTCSVALFGCAVGDHVGERDPTHPLGHEHLIALVHHVGHHHIGVTRELRRVLALCLCFQSVVQLLGHPVAQLGDERLDVHAGDERPEQPGEAAQLGEVRQKGLARSRVLHLDGDSAPVVPHGSVYLADGGGSGRFVLELHEELAPLRTQLLLQHGMDRAHRHGRSGFLEFGQRRPVGPGDLLGQRGFEDGEGLPELHGAALELAQNLEELLRGALLHLARHDLS